MTNSKQTDKEGKTLKPLEEYEREAREAFETAQSLNQPHPNGLACPNCGSELWDSNPTIVLTSNPPQKNIHCPKCGYKGYTYETKLPKQVNERFDKKFKDLISPPRVGRMNLAEYKDIKAFLTSELSLQKKEMIERIREKKQSHFTEWQTLGDYKDGYLDAVDNILDDIIQTIK